MQSTNERKLEKEEENKKLQLKKKFRKQEIKEKGITLIALVVTIIILLILAGVTLNIALSDNGLFSKAKKAAEDYKQAQSEEEDLISQFATQMYSEYVGAEVTGYNPTGESDSCSVGTETTGSGTLQNFTRKTLNWRVWDYDGNTLRIIADPTDTLTLKGPAGYNNGVWALDHICKELYSNGKKGVTVTNLKRTDIQKVSTYDYTKYKHQTNKYEEDTTNETEENRSSFIHFGETKTYNDNHQYPDMWSENDEEWTYKYEGGNATGGDKECKTWEDIGKEEGQMGNSMNDGSASTTFKQSYYFQNYKQNEFINDAYYDLIFKKANGDAAGQYWLAGRYVLLYESRCDFGVQFMRATSGHSYVSGGRMCYSNR